METDRADGGKWTRTLRRISEKTADEPPADVRGECVRQIVKRAREARLDIIARRTVPSGIPLRNRPPELLLRSCSRGTSLSRAIPKPSF